MKMTHVREILTKADGWNHHDRDALLARNGRWGTCVSCPRGDDGRVEPERCEHTARYDHNLKRPNHEAWAELARAEATEAALRKVAEMPCTSPGAGRWGFWADCREREAKAMGGKVPPEEQRESWCPRCVAADALESLPE